MNSEKNNSFFKSKEEMHPLNTLIDNSTEQKILRDAQAKCNKVIAKQNLDTLTFKNKKASDFPDIIDDFTDRDSGKPYRKYNIDNYMKLINDFRALQQSNLSEIKKIVFQVTKELANLPGRKGNSNLFSKAAYMAHDLENILKVFEKSTKTIIHSEKMPFKTNFIFNTKQTFENDVVNKWLWNACTEEEHKNAANTLFIYAQI